MYKKVLIFLILLLLVITQVSVLPVFFNFRRIPDLVLIVVIFFAARRGFASVWGIAVTAGFLLDIFSFFPVGTDILSFSLTALVVSFMAQRFFLTQSTWKLLILLALILIGTAVNDLTISLLMKIFLGFSKVSSTGFAAVSTDLWLKMLNNLLIFALIYWPLKKYENFKGVYSYGQHMFVRRPQ
jgi:rod shape-determining protein MreD